MKARVAVERQWAAACVADPWRRHVMLKYLVAYQVPAELVRFDDERALLMLRAVVSSVHAHQPVTVQTVAAHLAEHDFSLDSMEAVHFVGELVESIPADVDVERLALALIRAMGIRLPEHEITDSLRDPYGLRAELMRARKVREVR